MRRLRLVGALAVASATVFLVYACSSADPHPAASGVGDAGPTSTNDSSPPADSGRDASDASTDGPPAICSDGIFDGTETDVDCGGTICPRCQDGKHCVNDGDCAGGSCQDIDGQRICRTPTCNDGKRNGDETDVDCGGKTCPRCTIGKHCTQATDCASASCDNMQCACPSNMAIVTKASGGAYCIDQIEVTKGQYNKFLTANVSVATQINLCKSNTTFVPRGAWPPATTPENLAYHMGLPVHYVDWCDAYAYCRWQNKQLCGQINGGTVAMGEANDATKSAWYNACSAQGSLTYPYAGGFDDAKCNGGGGDAGGGFGYPSNQDESIWTVAASDDNGNVTGIAHSSCQGGVVKLFQMSGNVAEWEDSCADAGGDAAAFPSAPCRLRGGSYGAANAPAQLSCDADRTLERLPATADDVKDVGFRCCLY
jgi:formylglycine-generating enzyme required for sulfatase activity